MVEQSSDLSTTTTEPRPVAATVEPVIEVKPPLIWKLFLPFMLAASGFFFVVWPVMEWFDSIEPGAIDILVSHLVLLVVGTWLVGKAAIHMWHEMTLKLRGDSFGVTMQGSGQTHKASWEQIRSCTIDPRATTGKRGCWISLRDQSGNILLQWNRDWCRGTQDQMRQCVYLVAFIQRRLAGASGIEPMTEKDVRAAHDLLATYAKIDSRHCFRLKPKPGRDDFFFEGFIWEVNEDHITFSWTAPPGELEPGGDRPFRVPIRQIDLDSLIW